MFKKKTKYHYRIDTTLFIEQMDLEDAINAITSTELTEGKWRLHSIMIRPREEGETYNHATIICEREINA